MCNRGKGLVLVLVGIEVSLHTSVNELTCSIEVLNQLRLDRVCFLDDQVLNLQTCASCLWETRIRSATG